jgi:hypothetical protein
MKSAQEEQRLQEAVLAADLEDLIIRDPDRSLRFLAHEMSISSTDISKMVSEDLK